MSVLTELLHLVLTAALFILAWLVFRVMLRD